ncbi:MAG: DMT family transporter [Planctomycetes bacterium]|nr:DMT family transporter [Planctomycetota bacterium]
MNRTETETATASLHPEGLQPLGPAAIALTLLTVALWGGTPTAIKYSLDLLPVMAISAIRFAMAAVFMVIWCLLEGSSLKLRPEQRVPVLIFGVMLFLQIGLFTVAIELSNASHSSLFINTFIFWVTGIEHFITRESRLTLRKIFGLVIAAVGVALILLTTGSGTEEESRNNLPNLTGDLVMLASGFVLGVKIIYTKHALKTVEPSKLIFWHNCIGVALFALWSVLFERPDFSPFFSDKLLTDSTTRDAVLGLLYQGVVVAGFCFAVQAYLLKNHSASKISVFSFATPLFGMSLAVMLRGDPLSPWLLVSGWCVAVGILLVNLSPRVSKNKNDRSL